MIDCLAFFEVTLSHLNTMSVSVAVGRICVDKWRREGKEALTQQCM